jgi:hypothetical protein
MSRMSIFSASAVPEGLRSRSQLTFHSTSVSLGDRGLGGGAGGSRSRGGGVVTARDGFRAQTLEGGGVGRGGGGVRAKSVGFRAKTVRLPGFRLVGADGVGGGGGGVGGCMGRRSGEGADVDVGSNWAGQGGGGAGGKGPGEGGGMREGGKGRVDLLAWKPLLFQTNSLPRCCILLSFTLLYVVVY